MQRAVGSILAVALAGCGSVRDRDGTASKKAALSIGDVHGEVNPGEQSPAVRAVYEYLRQYGYFPNPNLEKQYPFWLPIIADDSPEADVFGPELERGVTSYQRFMGLNPTGRVDTKTLEVMQQPRCGHPENEFAARDSSDKFAYGYPKWNQTTLVFRLGTSTDQSGLTAMSVPPALDAALAGWRDATNLTLTQNTSGPLDVEVRWWPGGSPPSGSSWLVGGNTVDFDSPSQDIAETFAPNKIGLNTLFSYTSTPTLTTYDIQSILEHEIGHSLGLDHSSVQMSPFGTHMQALMFPTQPKDERLKLQPDDIQAVESLYRLWQAKPGYALDVAVGGPALDGSGNPVKPKVYATSVGATLFYWTFNNTSPDFGSWVQIAGNAVAVAVDDNGIPWAVSSDHSIWQGNGSDPTAFGFTWIPRSAGSGANDIAVGMGKVWIISNTAVPNSPGDYYVQTWNGTGWDSSAGGAGARIAVDAFGRPWVVQASHLVWRFFAPNDTAHFASNGTRSWQVVWQGINPTQVACATDITASSDQSVWVVGCTSMPNNNHDIWIWDEQTEISSDAGHDAPAEAQFIPVDGYATRIAASPDGRPWVSQAGGAIYRRSPKATTP